MEKSRYRVTLLCVRPAATALDKGSCFSEKTKKKRIKLQSFFMESKVEIEAVLESH